MKHIVTMTACEIRGTAVAANENEEIDSPVHPQNATNQFCCKVIHILRFRSFQYGLGPGKHFSPMRKHMRVVAVVNVLGFYDTEKKVTSMSQQAQTPHNDTTFLWGKANKQTQTQSARRSLKLRRLQDRTRTCFGYNGGAAEMNLGG